MDHSWAFRDLGVTPPASPFPVVICPTGARLMTVSLRYGQRLPKTKVQKSGNAKDSDAVPDAAVGKADTACPGDRDDVVAATALAAISRALESNTRSLCSLAAGMEKNTRMMVRMIELMS